MALFFFGAALQFSKSCVDELKLIMSFVWQCGSCFTISRTGCINYEPSLTGVNNSLV